ncbi:MAG: YIP1 family protein [archaeon]|jgi:hypothetical protein
MFSEWKKIATFRKPLTEVVNEATLGNGLKDLVIATFLVMLIIAITATINSTFMPLTVIQSLAKDFNLTIFWALIVVGPIIAIIGTLIGGGVLHIIAKILGGKASYGKFVGVFSKVGAAIEGFYQLIIQIILLVVTIVIAVAMPNSAGTSILTLVQLVLILVSLLVGLIGLYLSIKATSIVHELSMLKSAVVVLIIPIILLVIMVVGLLFVGLSMQVMNTGNGIPESTAKTAWKSAEPWGIVDWANSNGTLTVILRNNSNEPLDFVGMTIGTQNDYIGREGISPGGTITKTFNSTCTSGTKYSYPRNEISIIYNGSLIAGKTQNAAADIVGTCQ